MVPPEAQTTQIRKTELVFRRGKPEVCSPNIPGRGEFSAAPQRFDLANCTRWSSWFGCPGCPVHQGYSAFVTSLVLLDLALQIRGGARSGRIVAAGVPRVAAEDATNRTPRAADRAVLANHFDGVLAARRGESATGRNHRTDRDLIEPDQFDQNPGEKASNHEDDSSSAAARPSGHRPVLRTGCVAISEKSPTGQSTLVIPVHRNAMRLLVW